MDDSDFEEDVIRAKWAIDDATTLSEAAQKLRDYADYLETLEQEGWRLIMPVKDDYGHIERPRDMVVH